MKTSYKKNKKKGFGLVEVVVGVAVLGLTFLALVGAYSRFVAVSRNIVPTTQASYLLEEGIEIVKLWRDASWASKIATLSTTTTYYFAFSTTTADWSATTTASVGQIDGYFSRSLTLRDVWRDANNNISNTNSGTYDPYARKVTVTVSWTEGTTTTRSLSTYVTNLFGN